VALPTLRSLSGRKFKIYVGDGANPENFLWVAAFTSKSLDHKAATGTTNVPDDTDDSAPMIEEMEVTSLSLAAKGEAVLGMVDGTGVSASGIAFWRTWWKSGQAKNCRMVFSDTGANGGGYWEGAFLLTGWSLTGKTGEKVTASVDMPSAGAFDWVALA
jgi:hypothetical protein